MAKIEQTGRGNSVESKLDAEPESNHFATLRELVRDRLQKLMRPNARGGSIATEMGRRRYVRSAPDSDRRTDIAGGPKGATTGPMPTRHTATNF
jgi:hypothetical protein